MTLYKTLKTLTNLFSQQLTQISKYIQLIWGEKELNRNFILKKLRDIKNFQDHTNFG